jgi:hypothetical protein
MSAPRPPFQRNVVTKLGFAPHYAGSSHDDTVARQLGFRAALIPGAFLYGYMSRVGLDLWGKDWIAYGNLTARFRRPVYNRDALIIDVSGIRQDEHGQAIDIIIRNADGDAVAVGGAGLPNTPPIPPDLADWPVTDAAVAGPLLVIDAGELPQGHRVRTRNEVVTDDAFHRSLHDFDEDHPLYHHAGIIHPGMLLRQAMGDTNRSAQFLSPIILVSSTTQAFGIARAGDRFTTSGAVIAVYERKGNHYFDSEEVLIANATTPIAHFRRTSIYAPKRKPATV